MVEHLSTEDFAKIIKDKKVWILDVREEHEFKQGHLKGAWLVPTTCFWETFQKMKIKKSDKIALYCRSGNRSYYIAKQLEERGYQHIYNLELGIIDWITQNKPILTGNK